MVTPNFRTLDLNLLRVFDEVMSERNLTRAADKLALTQPAVSNALRRLRHALGDELVVRSGAGVAPTPRALSLWPAVRQALTQLQEALAPGTFDPASAQTSFVLALADATGTMLIPSLAQMLEREAPGVSLRVVPLTTRDPRQLLDDGEADMAVGYFPAALADLTAGAQHDRLVPFQSMRIYDSEYVCVMRAGHPLAQQPLSLDEYCAARHLLVSFSGKPYGFIDQALASLGRERRIALTVNQFFTAGRVVAASDLLTVLPRHFVGVANVRGDLVWRPLPMSVPIVHVDALWHRQRQADPGHRWLQQTLARAGRESAAQASTTLASIAATAP